MLGEFPTTRLAADAASEIVAAARRAGYVGALAWSVLAEDQASDFASAADELRLERRA